MAKFWFPVSKEEVEYLESQSERSDHIATLMSLGFYPDSKDSGSGIIFLQPLDAQAFRQSVDEDYPDGFYTICKGQKNLNFQCLQILVKLGRLPGTYPD